MRKATDALIDMMNVYKTYSCTARDGMMATAATIAIREGLMPLLDHPLDRADAMARRARSDKRFEKLRMRGHDLNGRRCILTLYRLKEAYHCPTSLL